ncbi:MAG: NAD(P)-dependent oxidoreductase [Lachnospiraceae bacterium]|nr:NAD(P)-dependent oxidoreductase [Lachnospiraceae bacterium]
MNDSYYADDIENVINSPLINWEIYKNKSFLITGATGLIAGVLVNSLLSADEKYSLDIKLIVTARSMDKIKRVYGNRADKLKIIMGDIVDFTDLEDEVDYIIHLASQTSSKGFVTYPVETATTNIKGTINMLELAKRKNVDCMVFLSTMEVYGVSLNEDKITEEKDLLVNSQKVRNSYPISKIMCENLMADYASEYGVKTVVGRLTQTFGAGIEYEDGRVFADFARCAVEGRNIVLKTEGKTKRNYLYNTDAVTAIFTLIDKADKSGAVYNVANEDSLITIADMAKMVAKNNGIDVEFDISEDVSKLGYAPTLVMNLSTDKLKSLGWEASVGLETMYDRLIGYMKGLKE